MKDKAYVWIGYSKNPPYLPVAVADTAKELGEMLGVSRNTIISNWCHARHGRRGLSRYQRVRVDEDEAPEIGGDSRG